MNRHAYAKQLAHLYVSEVFKTAEGYEDGLFILSVHRAIENSVDFFVPVKV